MINIFKDIIDEEMIEEIKKIEDLYNREEYEKLFETYKEDLQLDVNFEDAEAFIEGIEDEEMNLTIILLWYLVLKERVLLLDWSGEEYNGQVEEYINYMFREIYNENYEIDTQEVYDYFEEADSKRETRIKKGKHIPILLKFVSKELETKGYELINLDINSSDYYIVLIKDEVFNNIKNNEYENMKVQYIK